jgi:parvulin-like peptidyl-prolyl cis-trans isomerase-like protein
VQDISKKPLLLAIVISIASMMLYNFVDGGNANRSRNDIVVSSEQQEKLVSDFQRNWQRAPTDAELDKILRRFVRQEMAWRESIRLALGQDDADIRRRMRQKLESRAADQANQTLPTKNEMQTYLNEHADAFRIDSQLSFRQIFFDNHGNTIGADASARYMLGTLRNRDLPENSSELGDPSPLQAHFTGVRISEVSNMFGQQFAASLAEAGLREWVGPLSSSFGLHIVYVEERVEGRLPVLKEIEDKVRRRWLEDRRIAAIEEMYKDLTESYSITIE